MVIGPRGAGKSTLIGLIATQFLRYPGSQVFAFDNGYSSFALCNAVGGIHYDIAGDRSDNLAFCPWPTFTRPRSAAGPRNGSST